MISDAIAAIREVVEALGQNLFVQSVVSLGGNSYRIYLRSTLWLRVGNTVYFGEDTATVTAVECGYIEVTAEAAPTGRMNTDPIHFMHGTVVQVNNEMWSIRDAAEFTPLVYYVEASSGEVNTDPVQQIGFTNNARLLVLMSCDSESWLNSSHYTNVIEVTEDICEALIAALNKSPKVVPYISGRVANYVNVGLQNSTANGFDNYFSGTELKFNLPLRQTCNC